MSNNRRHRLTHLFTVRLWVEFVATDRREIRGRVQHVLTGEANHFRTWPELLALLEAKLSELESTGADV